MQLIFFAACQRIFRSTHPWVSRFFVRQDTPRVLGVAHRACIVLVLWALAGVGVQTPAHAQTSKTAPAALSAADEAFLDLKEAYTKRQVKAFEALYPKIKGHLLEPLADYWQLRLSGEHLQPEQVQRFYARWPGTYYEDRARNDDLLVLGRQQDWTRFLAEWPKLQMQDDRQVRCHYLHARYVTQGTLKPDELAEATRLWLEQKEAEEACTALADRLLTQKIIPSTVAWERARFGAERNRPAIVTQAVGLIEPAWLPTVQQLMKQPEKYLDGKLTAVRHRTKELVTLALLRLADTQPELAAQHLIRARWQVQLTSEEKSWAWGAIGRTAAQRLMPEALDWFGKGQARQMHPEHLTWWARAALRGGQWHTLHTVINAMPPTLQQDATWQYWLSRALQQRPQADAQAQAAALLHGIANPHHFYGQLALEDLGQAIAPTLAPAPLTPAEKHATRQRLGLQRALKLIAIGLRSEGVREWNFEIRLHHAQPLSDRELLAAADLACAQHVWDRCINTSDRTVQEVDATQRYPMPFKDAVLARTRTIGLDPAYVYGLIRQESRFVLNARSPVGASGLMQLMPATARWTAKKIGIDGFEASQVQDLETNIALGTAYLKLVLDELEGSLPMGAAAYNAGPGRPRQWRNTGTPIDAAIWAETIPFNETRDYVKKVLANTVQYAALLTGQAQSLKARLGQVGPRGNNSPGENRELP
jgi:soluble lytic murein transglycosylase